MVNLKHPAFTRIKNSIKNKRPKDFQFSPLGFILLLTFTALGLILQSIFYSIPEFNDTLSLFTAVLLSAALYALWPKWLTLLITPLALSLPLLLSLDLNQSLALSFNTLAPGFFLSFGLALAGVFLAPSLIIVLQWEKVVVLRFGRFHKVMEPGFHFLMPFMDFCAAFVDTRIRVTDFSAEKILTKDTVPLHIDALAFWMIWDGKKAILEVENYLEAVTLSAQTALRDSIGKYSLSTILSERETLYKEIQSILDAKTNPWGITILSVEFTDIVLPQELENVMSAQAQAEREKISRKLLSEAEAEIAQNFVQAAQTYDAHPQAMNLRGMSMVFEAMKTRGSMVMVPGSALEGMKLGGVTGLSALAKNLGKGTEDFENKLVQEGPKAETEGESND